VDPSGANRLYEGFFQKITRVPLVELAEPKVEPEHLCHFRNFRRYRNYIPKGSKPGYPEYNFFSRDQLP
jgi:hypothetical protein